MKNKILFYTFVLMLGLYFIGSSTFAQKKVTVYGEIVELSTFVKDNIKPTTPAGTEITLDNFKKGGTFVLLEKGTRKFVFLTGGSPDTKLEDQLKPYLGISVFIKGAVYKKGGIRLISVDDIGKYLK